MDVVQHSEDTLQRHLKWNTFLPLLTVGTDFHLPSCLLRTTCELLLSAPSGVECFDVQMVSPYQRSNLH